MFGYIRPNLPELKVREKERYEAWYCGLCRSLGKRYGQASRLVLSYDGAFLAMLLSAVTDRPSPCEKHLCPVHPLKKKKAMVQRENPALDYAADVCVILADFKLRDDAQDGKALRRAVSLPLRRAFRKAKRLRPEVYAAVESSIAELTRIEEEKLPSPDLAANTSGDMLRGIMANAPLPEELPEREAIAEVLPELGFFLGRTIYLCDAWEDREKDEKHGLYNAFNLAGTTREEAEFLANFSINSAISAYNLIEEKLGSDRGIADNIFYEGLFSVWDGITSGLTKRRGGNGKRFPHTGEAENERTDSKR
ncbi:MAG: hypothetical protein J5544_00440 [Clostridia bacterium]|nr:hypothetical protein [Clostridia bacterium]